MGQNHPPLAVTAKPRGKSMSSGSLALTLSNGAGAAKEARVAVRTWERRDAARVGMKWGGAVAALGVVMIPIPLIHFFSPIVLLIAPLAGFLIFRLYNGGVDMQGQGACPSCENPLELSGNADRWPVQMICPSCKRSVTVAPT